MLTFRSAICLLLLVTTFPFSVVAQIQVPVLKWQNAGCFSSWCETGWYSSPAVADLDGNGSQEIIASAYSVVVLDGATGTLKWRAKSGHDISQPSASNEGRTWPGIVVADVDGNGDLEIVSAHGSGYVSIYDHNGNFHPGWPQRPANREFRSLAVADLDNNNDLEIVVGRAQLNSTNVWVFEHTGAIRSSWPHLVGEGSAAGIYNDTIAIGNIDSDQELEIIVPSDTITICAYKSNGTQITTNSLYHNHTGHDMNYWGEVPCYVDLEYEVRGWGPCSTAGTHRANFANGPANIIDVNGDGINEIVAIGNVHDCSTSPYTNVYNTAYIFNRDRTRFNQNGNNWTTLPINTGAPIIQSYNTIESVQSNPVTVDIDGDGEIEILFPSYDGRLHAMWLDKTEHHSWPYSVYNASEGFYRFASEPLVVDLNADGHPEIIFTSWVQKGTYKTGKLHILSNKGVPIHEIDLPVAYGSSNWNGALAAPTIANIDNDSDFEIVINTSHSGFVAYDLPGTANARILWGTGRGSYLRNGTAKRINMLPPNAPSGLRIIK